MSSKIDCRAWSSARRSWEDSQENSGKANHWLPNLRLRWNHRASELSATQGEVDLRRLKLKPTKVGFALSWREFTRPLANSDFLVLLIMKFSISRPPLGAIALVFAAACGLPGCHSRSAVSSPTPGHPSQQQARSTVIFTDRAAESGIKYRWPQPTKRPL